MQHGKHKVTTSKINPFLKPTLTNSCLKCIHAIHEILRSILQTPIIQHFENFIVYLYNVPKMHSWRIYNFLETTNKTLQKIFNIIMELC